MLGVLYADAELATGFGVVEANWVARCVPEAVVTAECVLEAAVVIITVLCCWIVEEPLGAADEMAELLMELVPPVMLNELE